MYIRRAFTAFLAVQSEAEPCRTAVAARTLDWTLDWRWFDEPGGDGALPVEPRPIDWPAWARLRRPSPV